MGSEVQTKDAIDDDENEIVVKMNLQTVEALIKSEEKMRLSHVLPSLSLTRFKYFYISADQLILNDTLVVMQ